MVKIIGGGSLRIRRKAEDMRNGGCECANNRDAGSACRRRQKRSRKSKRRRRVAKLIPTIYSPNSQMANKKCVSQWKSAKHAHAIHRCGISRRRRRRTAMDNLIIIMWIDWAGGCYRRYQCRAIAAIPVCLSPVTSVWAHHSQGPFGNRQ